MRTTRWAVLLVAAVALPLAAPHALADHVEVNARTFPTGACERVCIPAVVQPRFASTPYLADDARVVGYAHAGDARAYPIEVLVWHEIVNDVVGGKAVAVTFCPLCGSSLVFDRAPLGEALTFQTSGRLFRNDLVMLDDETRSLWPQLLGQAVHGPMHGTRLEALPSTLATWGEWKAQHPGTRLLARPLCSDWPYAVNGCPTSSRNEARQYGADPYGGYAGDRRIGISGHASDDIQGLHPKTLVAGIVLGGVPKAWDSATGAQLGVITDDVGGTPVVVTFREGTLRVFARQGSQRFVPLDAERMRDGQGTAWGLASGAAEDGRQLEQLPAVSTFWFAWVDFHPDTLLHGAARVVGREPAEGVRVQPGAPVVLRFSHDMDRASVGRALRIEPPAGTNLTWRDDRTLAVLPAEAWAPGQSYVLRIDGASSRDGLPLAPQEVAFRAAGGLGAGLEGLGPALWVGALAAGALALAIARRKGWLRRS